MNIWTNIQKARKEKLKLETQLADAQPLMKFLSEERDNFTPKQRKDIIKGLGERFKEAGKKFLQRAFIEKILTEKEWKDIKHKYNLNEQDMGTILLPVFGRIDKHFKKDDVALIVTLKTTNIYKNRKFLEKRFNVKIVDTDKAIKRMKKEMSKKEIAKIEKKVKNEIRKGS